MDAGARNIVLLSRSGKPPSDAEEAFAALTAHESAKVVVRGESAKLAGTPPAALHFWLSNIGCTNAFQGGFGTVY